MTDTFTIRLVVASLGFLAVLCVAGGIGLAYTAKPIPDALIAIGSSAAGAISGILAKTSSNGVRSKR